MTEILSTLLVKSYFGNPLEDYLYCVLTISVGILAIRVADRLLLRWIRRLTRVTPNTWDEFLADTAERHLLPAFYAIAVYLGLRDLKLTPSVANALHLVVTVLVAVQGVRLALRIMQELLERQLAHRAGPEDAERDKRGAKGILALVKIVVWILAFVLVLDNIGIKVSTFVAGLGISGIAVALAAQAVLGDLFSYFVIFFDRPFQVGHTIKVGDFLGEVESIGIKTTRLRSLSGEQIIVSNKHLTDHQVHNFKLMSRRRVLFFFDVEYKTTDAQLRAIPGLVREIVSAFPDTTFDRSHFKEFAQSSLRFETVFFVESPQYNRYMDILQEIHLQLKARLETLGVGFAFPTRTILNATA